MSLVCNAPTSTTETKLPLAQAQSPSSLSALLQQANSPGSTTITARMDLQGRKTFTPGLVSPLPLFPKDVIKIISHIPQIQCQRDPKLSELITDLLIELFRFRKNTYISPESVASSLDRNPLVTVNLGITKKTLIDALFPSKNTAPIASLPVVESSAVAQL